MSARKFGIVGIALAAVLMSAPFAAADENAVGVITVRADTTFAIMQPSGVPMLIQLDENTKIQTTGNKKLAASELIPGLRVKVAGEYNSQNRLVAHRIEAGDEELKIARAIVAGLIEPNKKIEQNTSDIAANRTTLGEHGATLTTQGATIKRQGEEIVVNDQKMVATTGSITSRINNIDEFNVVDKLIVYFKNGRAEVGKDFAAQLQEFAGKAKGVDGYRLQVQGYASAVGPRAFNEVLSAKRADAVTAVLLQKGAVPPTNIFVPAPMGISEQFADNKTKEGQQENRRVVVTLLQSKGLPHP